MRTPTALDAMAKWLVLTLAGVGLFALVPGSSFAAPSFAETRWLLALHPVQFGALMMMALAWALFVVQLVRQARRWRRDPLSWALAMLALASVIAFVVGVSAGAADVLLSSFLVSLALHITLCVRIDWVAGRAGDPAPTASVRARKRRAVTAL